jgi:hypothetical protein
MTRGPECNHYAAALAERGARQLGSPRDPISLTSLYADIPFRYPGLFEELCLSYSWHELTIGEVEFAPNPPGRDLEAFASGIRYDGLLWRYLVSRGYLIFGRMSGGRYDPCAFDMNHRKGADAAIVRVDHEEVLSLERLGRPSAIANSFAAFLDANLQVGPGRGAA